MRRTDIVVAPGGEERRQTPLAGRPLRDNRERGGAPAARCYSPRVSTSLTTAESVVGAAAG